MGSDGWEAARSWIHDFLGWDGVLWKVWKSGLVWRNAAGQVIGWMNDGGALHIGMGVCTRAFGGSVEEVGNGGGLRGVKDGFSNCPETHRRDLEKRRASYMTWSKAVRTEIHFSSENYGYYCSFNYLNVLFP
jgi:hypothetical protein